MSGQQAKCENCRFFIDYRQPDDEPDEMDGYCCFDFVNGNTANEYGGHWTRHSLWCIEWTGGPPVFGEASGVQDPHVESEPGKEEKVSREWP